MNIALATLNVGVAMLNMFDAPHDSESRPNHAELCYTSQHDRYPMMLIEVPDKPARIMPYNATGSPSGSESVFDVSPYNQPNTTASSAIWVEIAGPDSHVCDGTGRIIFAVKREMK